MVLTSYELSNTSGVNRPKFYVGLNKQRLGIYLFVLYDELTGFFGV